MVNLLDIIADQGARHKRRVAKKARLWCRDCAKFTWHLVTGKDRTALVYNADFASDSYGLPVSFYSCSECGKGHEPTSLKDIPLGLIEEQRRMYKAHKVSEFKRMMDYGAYPAFELFFSIVAWRGNQNQYNDVILSDVGAIWEEMENDIESNNTKIHAISVYNKFKGVSRNDKCPCGSHLKFKRCHISEFGVAKNLLGYSIQSELELTGLYEDTESFKLKEIKNKVIN